MEFIDFINDKIIFPIKRRFFKDKVKTSIIGAIIFLVPLVIATILDFRYMNVSGDLPRWYIYFRSLLVVISSLSLTMAALLTKEKIVRIRKSKNEEYTELRKRMSFTQRRNLSLIIAVLVIALHLFLIDPKSGIYSIISTFTISILMYLILFSFPTVYEKQLEEQGFTDIRDINHKFKEFDKDQSKEEKKEETEEEPNEEE